MIIKRPFGAAPAAGHAGGGRGRRPRCSLGAGGPPRVPPPPAGAACSPAARGGARSGQAALRTISQALTEQGFHSPSGRPYGAESVKRMLDANG
jgi:hypothetical protein